MVIIKITISLNVIGLKNSYFPLIHWTSCYRTVSRLRCFRFLFFQGALQQHSLRQPTSSRIIVTEAESASSHNSDERLNTNIIVHGKNDNTDDNLL